MMPPTSPGQEENRLIRDSRKAGEGEAEQCSRCRRPLCPEDVRYSVTGDLTCPVCESLENRAASQRSANSVRFAAYAALVIGIISIFFNPLWVFPFTSVSIAVISLIGIISNGEIRVRVGGHFLPILFCIISSIAIALSLVAIAALGLSSSFD